ncbi:MAG: HK97 gp10 family phage protein [Clostridia bacterium]|nr:HK97 gp10 family phage protein [Clostridia bacterium]
MAGKITPDQLPEKLDGILSEFLHSSFDTRQEALQAGAEVFKDAVAAATPKDTGEMAESWAIKTKYKDRRYVGSTRVAKGVVHRKKKGGGKGEAREGVPLSNVLEYAENSPHKGFIRRCFDSTEPQIFAAIKSKLNNGGK